MRHMKGEGTFGTELMEIRQLNRTDLAQIRGVWKECFNDSDAFLDTYFESVADASSGIGFFDGSRLVSDLFVITMNAQISGMVYESEFLAGCATLPEARDQHLMRNLIRAALMDMRSRNVCVSFLHPFLHSFYRKFGYETVNYVREYTAPPQVGNGSVRTATSLAELPEDAVYESYQAYVSQYGSYFMRSRQRMHGWLELLFSDGGFAVYIEEEKNTPYALFYGGIDASGQPTANVFELVYFGQDELTAITTGTGRTAVYMLPCAPDERGAAEYTMMRIVCPEIMLETYPYSPGTEPFVINIDDPFLQMDYNLQVTPSREGASVKDIEAASDIVVGIDELARLFTGTYSETQFPDAAGIFRRNSSCYFDTY